jgi:hypothetical protein
MIAAERKEQKQRDEECQARLDASEWVEAHHPEYVESFAFLTKLSGKKKPWKAIEHSWPDLVAGLKAKGRAYAEGFIDEVQAQWQWIEDAWKYAAYAEGVSDGRRWASTIAAADQLERLRSALQYSGRRVLFDIDDRVPELSGAHSLLAWILGHDVYPSPEVQLDEDEWEFDSNSDEFKSFWQPFFRCPWTN